jgi:bifunctional DNA-binding transcriptional regulator/antitoxin component of YhaV-PrlF toxin-antitoxin module
MIEVVATIDGTYRIMLPTEIRARLGVGARDKITFVLDEHGVRIEPVRSILSDLYGTVPALPGEIADLEKEIGEAMAAEADRIVS